METLFLDEIGIILDKLMPADWWALTFTCKKWSQRLIRVLEKRRSETFTRIKKLCKAHGITTKDAKDSICLIPCYYSELLICCLGEVKRWRCARHRTLSINGVDLCIKCKVSPASPKCFGPHCNKLSCRDYLFILKNGKSVKVPGYPCRVESCNHLSDSPRGWCYTHALEASEQGLSETHTSYQCLGTTIAGHPCRFSTTSRCQKCHAHSYKYTDF